MTTFQLTGEGRPQVPLPQYIIFQAQEDTRVEPTMLHKLAGKISSHERIQNSPAVFKPTGSRDYKSTTQTSQQTPL